MFHVAFALSGDRDAKMLAVCVRSLAEACSCRSRLRIHILWGGLSPESRQKLERSWTGLELAISWYSMALSFGDEAQIPRNGHYFRVYLGSVLPESVDRVLYLDYDTLVGKDVVELWGTDLEGKVAAVVWDGCARIFDYEGQLREAVARIGRNRSPNQGYFNAGVMFLNLRLWRELKLEDQVMELVRAHPGWSSFVIQDELNLLLQDRLVALDPSWNLLETISLYERWDFGLYAEHGDPRRYFRPAIVHFAGSNKPYHALVRRGCKEAFYDVLDQTDWKGWRSANDRAWWGHRLANLLELHWLLCRGVKQGCLRRPYRHVWALIKRDHTVLLTYPLIWFYRMFRFLARQCHSYCLRMSKHPPVMKDSDVTCSVFWEGLL